MPTTRELRLRVRSIKNLAQVTKALETVSASYVRKSIQAMMATGPYAEKAWKVILHLARQPGHANLHPLLTDPRDPADPRDPGERGDFRSVLVVMISSDRGLAGAYNMNIMRETLSRSAALRVPVSYVAVGRKGRDLLIRRRKDVIADFSHLPNPPGFADVSAIGRLVVEDFEKGIYDRVYLAYTEFYNMVVQRPVFRKLLPVEAKYSETPEPNAVNVTHRTKAVFTYEPDQDELLSQIVPRFTALQIYQAILSAQASEHAARMIAMRNASESANDLIGMLQLEYNKLRQQLITSEMLDITGGAEALKKVNSE